MSKNNKRKSKNSNLNKSLKNSTKEAKLKNLEAKKDENKQTTKTNLDIKNKEVKKIKKSISINLIYYYLFLIIYLEVLTKIFVYKSLDGIFLTIIFGIPFILLLYIFVNIFKEKGNKVLTIIISFILTFYYIFQTIFYKLFSVLFSFNSLNMASNILDFKSIAVNTIMQNIFLIIIYFIPFILLIIFFKKFNYKRHSLKNISIVFSLMVIIYGLSFLLLLPQKEDANSLYNLYFNINDQFRTTKELGLFTSTRLDIKRTILGFNEKIIISPKENILETNVEEPEKLVEYNELNINFDELINNENNPKIKEILEYFKESIPTNKNEYTGLFKGKNLIFILAEGFNSIAVDQNLTPTLYKLTHEGFVFNNFYSPVFLSTTGGEFQAMTGLIPTQSTLSSWKKNTPNIKYAIGNSFGNIGYYTSSYHNWTYTYYNRDKTMPTLGFNNYLGCQNGMEKLISCKWLPSDIDMINATVPLYSDNEHFVTYYITVSGHAPYAYNSTGNSIVLKNIDLVKDLPYSNSVLAYLATQIEFDRALETLIKALEEKGMLDDTVIAFAGDHYPYTLTMDEINEISTYKRDEIIEVNHSNFVIWNNTIKEPIYIDKVGSEIDILPTLLNLFGIEYDSRLIVGKDILSDTPGLAIFSNRSWVSDIGTYKNGKFTLKESKEVEDKTAYINYINNIVQNNFIISNDIIKYNMYDYILK